MSPLSRRTGKRGQAREHLTTATIMCREMNTRFSLTQAEAEPWEPARDLSAVLAGPG
jgi:hypothetical protein